MLLFSTILDIQETLTKEAFIDLVLKWNDEQPMDVNRIPDVEWTGEWGTRYGTDDLWIQFDEYRNGNIAAARYMKNDNGAVWTTDYVMNFNTMKMAVQLDRSYQEDMPVRKMFSAPLFISTLADEGVLKDDGILRVLSVPQIVDKDDLPLLADIINAEMEHRMPVVYVSRTEANEFVVDVASLARRLRGIAHVLVEGDVGLNGELRSLCEDQNEFYGAIGIYCNNGGTVKHKKFLPRSNQDEDTDYDEVLKFMVVNWVNRFTNDRYVEPLYTWLGVQNAMTNARLEAAREERQIAKREVEDVYAEFDEELKELQQRNEELSNEIDSLRQENQGLRGKLYRSDKAPLLFYGEEEGLFPDEILDFVMETLEKGLTNCEANSRRADILQDLLQSNEFPHVLKERRDELKAALSNYTEMDKATKSTLKKLGFEMTSDNKHYRMTYYNDSRYKATLAKTPSDSRGSKNNVSEICKKCM